MISPVRVSPDGEVIGFVLSFGTRHIGIVWQQKLETAGWDLMRMLAPTFPSPEDAARAVRVAFNGHLTTTDS